MPRRRAIVGALAAVGVVAFIAEPLIFLWLVTPSAPSPMYLFSFAMNSPILFAYPLVAVALWLAPHTSLWRQGYVRQVTLRSSYFRFFGRGVGRNAAVVGAVFFAQPLMTFTVIFVLLPLFGYGYVSAAEWGQVHPDASYARLTELMAVSPVLYILVYSASFALVGAGLGIFGHLLLAAGVKPTIALASPAVLVLVSSALLGFGQFALTSVLVPFGLTQVAPWTLIVPFTTLACAIAAALALATRRQSVVLARL